MTILFSILQVQGDSTLLQRALASPATPRWTAAAMLLLVMLILLVGFLRTVREDPPRIESHWGGFGGGLGGWRMSASLAYLVAVIAFAAMFTMVVQQSKPPEDKQHVGADSKKESGGKADAGKADDGKVDGAKAAPSAPATKK